MKMGMDGKPIKEEYKISTTDRISIAQCMNLAREELGNKELPNYEAKFKEVVKVFYKLKQELETEFKQKGGTF